MSKLRQVYFRVTNWLLLKCTMVITANLHVNIVFHNYFCFRRLKMKELSQYEIPDVIRNIEFHNDTASFEVYKSMVEKSRADENCYIGAFRAMVQLEQAANSKFLEKFHMKNVKLDLHTLDDQIFQIKVNVSVNMT